MEFKGIDIQVEKRRYIERIPTDGPYGKMKDLIVTESTIAIRIGGTKIPDPAFPFEFLAILEEFIAKKLNAYKEDETLNYITETEDSLFSIYITRQGNILQITRMLSVGDVPIDFELDMIEAKTVASMLHKAIYAIELR